MHKFLKLILYIELNDADLFYCLSHYTFLNTTPKTVHHLKALDLFYNITVFVFLYPLIFLDF